MIIVLWEYRVSKVIQLMVRIWGGMIRNELTDLFRVPEELKLPSDVYCSFRKKSVEALNGNLLLAQLKKIVFSRDHLHV